MHLLIDVSEETLCRRHILILSLQMKARVRIAKVHLISAGACDLILLVVTAPFGITGTHHFCLPASQGVVRRHDISSINGCVPKIVVNLFACVSCCY